MLWTYAIELDVIIHFIVFNKPTHNHLSFELSLLRLHRQHLYTLLQNEEIAPSVLVLELMLVFLKSNKRFYFTVFET